MHIFTLSMSRQVKPALCLFLSAALVASLMTAIFAVNSDALAAQISTGNRDNVQTPNTDLLNNSNWDTDNLDFGGGSITARSFGVPIFSYSGGHDACVTGAPGFYQTPEELEDGSFVGRVNDFPIAKDYTEGVVWDSDAPCVVFAGEQDRLVKTIEDGKLYHAVLDGGEWVVKEREDPGWFQNRVSALVYGDWVDKGLNNGFETNQSSVCGVLIDSTADYTARIDYDTLDEEFKALEPHLAGYTSDPVRVPQTRQLGIPFSIDITGGRFDDGSLCAGVSDVARQDFLTVSDSALCAGGLHPRGEDSSWLLRPGSGRTLSSLANNVTTRWANEFWCRSDVRYERVFQGAAEAGAADLRFDAPVGGSQRVSPQMDEFRGWGRMNCYHTALGVDPQADVLVGGDPVDRAPACIYVFPLPECAESLSAAELDAWKNKPVLDMVAAGCGEPEEVEEEEEEEEEVEDGGVSLPPVERPEFDVDPCDFFGFSVRENIPSGLSVIPGLDVRYNTALGGHELGSVAPHAATASPPRRVGDKMGCADGVETRTDHSEGERKTGDGGSAPVMSARTDTAPPPGFDLEDYGNIVYEPVRQNFAHRTASFVAENDCSVLRAEAVYLRGLARNQLLAIANEIAELKDDAADAWSDWVNYAPGSNTGTGFYKEAADITRAAYAGYDTAKTGAAQQLMVDAGNAETMLRDAARMLPEFTDDLTTQGPGCAQKLSEDSGDIMTAATDAITAAVTNTLNSPLSSYQDERYPASVDVSAPPEVSEHLLGSPRSVVFTGKAVTPAVTEEEEVCPKGAELGVFLGGNSCFLNGVLVEMETIVVVTTPASTQCSWSQTQAVRATKTLSYTHNGATKATRQTTTTSSERSATLPEPLPGDVPCPGTASGWGGWTVIGTPVVGNWSPTMPGNMPGLTNPPNIPLSFTQPVFDAYDPGKRAARKTELLGGLHPDSPDRAELTSAGVGGVMLPAGLTGVPSETMLDAALMSYQTKYKDAYKAGFDNALADLGGTDIGVWSGLGWSYDMDSLAWERYVVEEGEWCDGTQPRSGSDDSNVLLNVPLSGEVGAWAERLDFETKQINGASPPPLPPPASWLVECKVIRERTPKVDLKYVPQWGEPRWSAVRDGLDNIGIGVLGSNLVDLKLEYDLFQLDITLADAEPILCHTSYNTNRGGTVFNVASSAGGGVDVLAAASAHSRLTWAGPQGIETYKVPNAILTTKAHCGTSPSAGTADGWTWFDDTAHSDMTHVWTARRVPPAADALELLPIAKAEAVYSRDFTSSSNFYGTVWDITKPTNGWSGIDNSLINLGSRFEYALLASDKPIPEIVDGNFKTSVETGLQNRDWLGWPGATIPSEANVSWHLISIGFLNCLPDVEDAAFIHTITAFEEGNNPRQDFNWDKLPYDRAGIRGGSDEFANLEVDAWYNPPLNLFEGNELRVLEEEFDKAEDGQNQTLVRQPGGGIPHPKYGDVIKWYLRTEPNRPQDIGQYVTVIRYTDADIARASIDAGCGTPVIPVPTPNPGRYQSSKLGTKLTAGPGGVDANAPLIVWSQHSDFYAGNPDKPAWEPRWYFADQVLSALCWHSKTLAKLLGW